MPDSELDNVMELIDFIRDHHLLWDIFITHYKDYLKYRERLTESIKAMDQLGIEHEILSRYLPPIYHY